MYQDQSTDADNIRTVRLTRKDLLAVTRLLRLLDGTEDHSENAPSQLERPARHMTDSERTSLAERARDEVRNRRRRELLFGKSMFGEAAWDMLIMLYSLDVSGDRQTVGSLLRKTGTSMTTGLRWLGYLVSHGLVRRDPHPTDLRTEFVTLTSKAREMLDVYYSGTSRTDV